MPQRSRFSPQIVMTNNEDNTIDVLIDSLRYRYFFHARPSEILHTYHSMAKHSVGKAFAYLKKQAYKFERIGN